ncbi:hypothetical protein CE91St58_09700 [Lachnospiraceae bacterium]|nr:hypothetical protein CE91St58_09700 [Lachnospiraceae bacterium]
MEAGILEIYRYVPIALLERPVEEMDIDTYTEYLAKARYLEEVEMKIHLKALTKYFEE